jgi:hypothetical protein
MLAWCDVRLVRDWGRYCWVLARENKRRPRGVYRHCKEKHLHRYLSEYDFRYNTRTALGFNDLMRAEIAAKGIAGKRLTYRRPA